MGIKDVGLLALMWSFTTSERLVSYIIAKLIRFGIFNTYLPRLTNIVYALRSLTFWRL